MRSLTHTLRLGCIAKYITITPKTKKIHIASRYFLNYPPFDEDLAC
jgi:hypothetical protein